MDRVLFVCAGNTCRSPMAAAVAASTFREVTAESAGWIPTASGVAENAVTVVREMTGTDISDHRTRDVAALDLSEFDLIVVLSARVAEELVVPRHVPLLVWEIPDPYGGPIGDYRECAELLRRRIRELGHAG